MCEGVAACRDGFVRGADGKSVPCSRCNRAAWVEHVGQVAYAQGYEAYSDGDRRCTCPYPAGDGARDAWLAGWDASREDSDEWLTGKGPGDGN